MSQRLVKAGVWQGPAVRGDLRANLEQVAAAAAEAHTDGVEVLVFPELFALGPWRPGCHAEDSLSEFIQAAVRDRRESFGV